MRNSFLLDQKPAFRVGGTAAIHTEIKLSWMLISSFAVHLVFFLGLFLLAPRATPDHFQIQDYPVTLVSPKLFDSGQNLHPPPEIIPAPIMPPAPPVKDMTAHIRIPTLKPAPPKALPSVHPTAVNTEIQKDVILKEMPHPLPPAKFIPPDEPEILQRDTAPLPVAPVSPSTPVSPEKNGVGVNLSVGGSAEGTSQNSSANRGLDSWRKRTQQKISKQWKPLSASAISTKQELAMTVIKFMVNQEGNIKFASVETSSGNSSYDRAALRAFLNANPLPTPPEGIFKDHWVHITFTVGPDS